VDKGRLVQDHSIEETGWKSRPGSMNADHTWPSKSKAQANNPTLGKKLGTFRLKKGRLMRSLDS
jgi:hypothetical protein